MDDMTDKIGTILNDPQMMQKIMTMAKSLGGQQPEPEPPKQISGERLPQIDMAMIQKLAGFAQQSGIDKREQALLGALAAYLTGDRVARLEKAMRAAKMARMATSVMSQQAQKTSGR